MSTIIECPACSTRYKMNKPIPEGGRSVKCARCGNQWRLAPEGASEETIEADMVEDNAVAPQGHFPPQPGHEAAAAWTPEPPAWGSDRAPAAPWQPGRQTLTGAISTLSEPQAIHHHEVAADTEEEDEGTDGFDWQNFDEEEQGGTHAGFEEHDSPGGFDLSTEASAVEDVADEDGALDADEPEVSGESWGGRIDRPWREIVEASRMSAEEDEEDAEFAIREALKAALENPTEADAAGTGGFEEQPRSNAGWDSFDPRDMRPRHAVSEPQSGAEDEHIAEDEAEDAAEGAVDAATHAGFTVPGHNPDDDPDEGEEDEAPFRLTGLSAKRPVYSAEDDEEDTGEADAAQFEAGFRSDIEDAFRAAPLSKRPVEPETAHRGGALSDFDRLFDEQAAADQAGTGFYDEDAAAALQAELESTDLAAYENRRGGGGLAVAAAWAVFFSVVSGVALAVVALRSEIMTALPGTTSLYRAIGFDVAERGIDFADVSYRWTTAQGKPMIEVKGQVVNVTDRRVAVPRVLINVRDSESSDPVKVTASVPTESLAPRESASFTLEFVSPPKNISQIELEFDRNR